MRSKCGFLLLCSLGVFLPACGGSSEKKIVSTVSGTVTYKGNPLNSGTVVFLGDKVSFVGNIDGSGSYKVENPAAGSYKVSVTTPGVGPGGITADGIKPIKIPEKYSSPGTSGLSYTVKEGDQRYDIKLTGG